MRVLLVGLALLAASSLRAQRPDSARITQIMTSASAERSVVPNLATLSARFSASGRTEADAGARLAARTDSIRRALGTLGIPKDSLPNRARWWWWPGRISSSVSSKCVPVPHKQTEPEHCEMRYDTTYVATDAIEIRIHDLTRLGAVIDTLMSRKVVDMSGIEFTATDVSAEAIILGVAALLASHQAPAPAHFGIVFHSPDGQADAIPGQYTGTTFVADSSNNQLPLHSPLSGAWPDGTPVQVTIDSQGSEHDVVGDNEYSVHLSPPTLRDTAGMVLFWSGDLKAHPLPERVGVLDSAMAHALQKRARHLVRLALPEADEGMVDDFDTLLVDHPFVLVTKGGLEAVTYRIHFAKGGKVTDDRGMAFFLYDPNVGRILLQNFGHPEWAPSADSVFAIAPREFFTIEGDSHTYLVANIWGAWESSDHWVMIDATTGQILTDNWYPLSQR